MRRTMNRTNCPHLCLAALLLCLTVLPARLPAAGSVTSIERVMSIAEHDSLIRLLADTSLGDTGLCRDQEGNESKVYSGPGGVRVRTNDPRIATPGRAWSQCISANTDQACTSPVIFECQEPGGDVLLMVLWREEIAGNAEVFRSVRMPGVFPPRWSIPLDVTLRTSRQTRAQ